jgi:hypothetical protein
MHLLHDGGFSIRTYPVRGRAAMPTDAAARPASATAVVMSIVNWDPAARIAALVAQPSPISSFARTAGE